MSWLLDADVLSQPAKRRGDSHVIAWLGREEARCYTSTVVVAQLTHWVRWPDSYLAATARRYGFTVVTGNDRDYRRPGVEVLIHVLSGELARSWRGHRT